MLLPLTLFTREILPVPLSANLAANASNNDDSPLGDYIYLKNVRSLPLR